MRQLITRFSATVCLATALVGITTLRSASAEDLFSTDSLNKVFNPTVPAQNDPAPPQVPQDPTSPEQSPTQPAPQSKVLQPTEIPAFLAAIGHKSEDLGDGVYKITVKKGEWTLPYVFVISPNKTQFWVSLSLNTLQEGVSIPAEKMQGMLEFNHNYGPVHFAFSGKFRKIFVCRAMKNDSLKLDDVQQVIDVLADLAIKHEDLWNHAKWQTTPQPPVQQQVQRPVQPPVQPAPAPRHVGTWRATSADKSTFQLTLNADGTFVLYHTQTTKQDKSVGTYTLVGNQLTLLIGQNDKLESFVTWYSNGTWRFQVKDADPGAQGLLFAKI